VSDRAKIYDYDSGKLKIIFDNEKFCIIQFFKLANSKIVSLIKRLHHIKKTLTQWYLNVSKENPDDKPINSSESLKKNRKIIINDTIKNSQNITENDLNENQPLGLKIIHQQIKQKKEVIIMDNLSEEKNSINKLSNNSIIFNPKSRSKEFKIKVNMNKYKTTDEYNNSSNKETLGGDDGQLKNSHTYNNSAVLTHDNNIIWKIKSSLRKLKSESFVNSIDKNSDTNDNIFLTNKKLINKESESQPISSRDNHRRNFSLKNPNPVITRISFLNLKDYEKLSYPSTRLADASTSPQRTDNLNKKELPLNSQKMFFRHILTSSTKSDLIATHKKEIPYNDSLPVINKFHNPNQIIRETNFEDNVDNKNNMQDEFNFNLNFPKSKFIVNIVKEYHENLKTKGLTKNLTNKNSLIKMKTKFKKSESNNTKVLSK
jgi:hypothetical protein